MLFKIYNTAISYLDWGISSVEGLYCRGSKNWYTWRDTRNTCRKFEKDLFQTAYIEDWKGSSITARQGFDGSLYARRMECRRFMLYYKIQFLCFFVSFLVFLLVNK